MTEYKFENCRVRIHGTPDRERLEAATQTFLKKVVQNEKQKKKRNAESKTA